MAAQAPTDALKELKGSCDHASLLSEIPARLVAWLLACLLVWYIPN